jgi:hypothetical protein
MMKKKRIELNSKICDRGHTLILVFILLLLGSLIIAPFLSYLNTGTRTGLEFVRKTNEFYAADSGIQDGQWQIRFNHLGETFTDYNPYDYASSWYYYLPEEVNTFTVNTTIQNSWIPKDLPPPSESDAERILGGVGTDPPKVIITGTISDVATFEIKIQYYPDVGEELRIDTIGVWLPTGFTYVDGSGSLESAPYNFTSVVEPWAGGQAVLWSCGSYPFIGDGFNAPFPGVDPTDIPMVSTMTFQYNGPLNQELEAISWVDTNLDLTRGGTESITYAWDADIRVYKITAVAGGTEIEAYFPKSEVRELGAAIGGDYRATGNSLMARSNNTYKYRDILLNETSATVDDIPSGAHVAKAYLYWSGWYKDITSIWGPDDCSDFTAPVMDWIVGSAWDTSSTTFRGFTFGESNPDRYLTMDSSIDLSAYIGEIVKVSWQQWEDGGLNPNDALEFQLSGDDGITWSSYITAFSGNIGNSPQNFTFTVPAQYLTSNFKIRFYLENFENSGEIAYIDNIEIKWLPADTTAIFKIDGQQVYFDTNGDPQQGNQEIIADSANLGDRVQVIDNTSHGNPHGYSYSSRKDVTALVSEYSNGGNADYAVGSVDATWDADDEWAYAGWSLVIIYSSVDTVGHRLYLYDDFLYKDHDGTFLDFNQDGSEGGTISGFIIPEMVSGEVNAARITAFVGEGDIWYSGDYLQFNGDRLWDGTTTNGNTESGPNNCWNGESVGMSAEGVDVDTFYITWSGGLLEPGDTSAQIDIWTNNDIWNLVYIILSFRSESSTGRSLSYIVH